MSRSHSKDVDKMDDKGIARSASRDGAGDRTLPRNYNKDTEGGQRTLQRKDIQQPIVPMGDRTIPRNYGKEVPRNKDGGPYEPFMFRQDPGEVGYMITEL